MKHYKDDRKADSFTLQDVLKDVYAANNLEYGLEKVRVEQAWTTVLGASVGAYTQGIDFNHGTLTVYLSSATMRQELSFGIQKIIALINEEMGSKVVEKLILR